MVNFADAISKITVSGKVTDISNKSKVRYILTKDISIPKLSQANKLRTEVEVNNGIVPMSVAELVGRYQSRLDSCGEWAPWSKIGQQLSNKHNLR